MKIVVKIAIFLIIVFAITFFLMFLNMCINPKIVHLTKYETLNFIRDDIPHFFLLDKENNNIENFNTLEYPYVFKPNYCEDYAHQVEIIKNKQQAIKYLQKSIDKYVIAQKYHPGPFEGTIYYTKHPITKKVRIIVVERKHNNSNKEWLWKSSVGYKYGYSTVHRPDLETEELKQKVISMSEKIPEFYLGRYDLRFKNHESFKLGKDFKVVEVNNQGASDTRYNVNNSSWYNLQIFARYIGLHVEYGLLNILKGNVVTFEVFIYMLNKYFTKTSECKQTDKVINVFDKLFKSFSII